MIKLNVGGGRLVKSGFTNIDIVQFVDQKGSECVDVVMDIEKEKLPYEDGTVDEIIIDNVLEHLVELRHVMNECHRVLKEGGVMWGCVPVANSFIALKDPTHVRVFIPETFSYFVGQSEAKPDRPKHPKYADYEFMPWIHAEELKVENDLINFKMKPRKINN